MPACILLLAQTTRSRVQQTPVGESPYLFSWLSYLHAGKGYVLNPAGLCCTLHPERKLCACLVTGLDYLMHYGSSIPRVKLTPHPDLLTASWVHGACKSSRMPMQPC